MDAMSAFKANVKRVDIESYNLCNRCCATCPQSLGIRSKELELFDIEVYEKLINELVQCQYSQTLALGRYHEPLLFPDLTLERISIARRHLPAMRIILNTNGDFLSADILKSLSEVGLSEIKIMRYQPDGYSTQQGQTMCAEMASALGKKIIRRNIVEDENCYLQLENEGPTAVSVRSENYYSNRGNGRGGLLPDLLTTLRTNACFVPHKSIDIDYNGNVVPCCNMISDSRLHEPYIIGNIRNNTIYDMYWRSIHSDFYRAITHGEFENHLVCQYCTYSF